MRILLRHYWRSSSSYRVRLALALKGVAYEPFAVNLLRGEQTAAENLAASPMGTVPCLVVDGRPLTESVAICEWLEDAFPEPPLLPNDPWARARVREIVEIVNSGTQPLHNLGVLGRHASDVEEQRAWARHFIERGLSAVEAKLAALAPDGPHALGAAISLADVFVLPQVYQARRFGADLASMPRVRAVADALDATPAGRRAAPEAQADAIA